MGLHDFRILLAAFNEGGLTAGGEDDLQESPMIVWMDARRAALAAYDDWCRARDRDSYIAYRAAADRLDAAQDALAQDAVRARR